MAKTKKINKSAAIRDALTANPAASAKEIIAILSKQGLKVQVPLVYMIKSKTRHKAQKQKRASIAASFKHANAIELITGIRKLAKDAGGMENLKKFVAALTE